MKFEEEFKVGIREIGLKNEITNYGILAFLEDLATYHSDTVGYGVKDIPINKGAWLLMDWELEVKKRARFNDVLTINTYAPILDKLSFHCYRNFEIYNASSELIATATSKWIFYNFELNKITKLTSEMFCQFQPEGEAIEAERKLLKLKEPSSYENASIYNYTVKRMDIDVNKHMNNLNYLRLAYEVLPENIYFDNELNNLRIMYKHQIKLGDKVKCFYIKKDERNIISIKSADEKTLHAIVELW